MKIKYFGKVDNGQLKIVHRALFDQDIKQLEGKEVELTVVKKKRTRSNYQNRYYWGAVIPIIQSELHKLGNIYTAEQIHDILKALFLKTDEPVGEDGLFITRIKSTTELSTSEFMDYLKEITIWAAQFLCVEIPEPNEQVGMEL